ncbi:hypothetical protein [Atlanticothrix silvestris]|nr:hypothetical protein [Atlanticothrix silvestris]
MTSAKDTIFVHYEWHTHRRSHPRSVDVFAVIEIWFLKPNLY